MAAPTPLTAYQQTYHWRNKNCGPWAHEWVRKTLPGTSAEGVEIVSVTNVSGDCDLGQRKGKLLTIYDLEVEMSWKGESKDGEEVKGTVKVPEVSHEAIDGLSDYVYEFRLTTASSSDAQTVLALAKKALPGVLSAKFNGLRPALLEAHGTPDAPSASGSGTSTPNASSGHYSPAPPTKAPEEAKPAKAEEKKADVGSVATVEVKAELRASADDLWGLLTDETKIPMWSRAPAKLSLTPDAPFELFAGNVRGKVVTVDAPKKLVQSWQARNPQWPSDHYGTMTMTLEQGSESTTATFKLEGVPVGCQDEVERALDTFYIRGLKQMGLVLSSSSQSHRTRPRKRPKTTKAPARGSWPRIPDSSLVGGALVFGLSAVLVAVVWSTFRE